MGRVLRARDVVLDTPVALKIVRPDLAADERFRKLFELEVRISARFTHPHIVPLHDHGETPDGTPYLGLALADAGSFAALRDEVVRWEELLRLSLELLQALGYIHSRDVLHRDLKPENVLLYRGDDGERHAWLADLGLANAGATLAKKKGRTEGTPGYMSPEQQMGLPREYGPWTDLYAVGVMLWEIVTGERPFPDDKTAMNAPLPDLTPRAGMAIPGDLYAVLANLLYPEPLSRYDLAADLRTELLALGPAGSPSRERDEETHRGTVAPSAPSVTSDVGEFAKEIRTTSQVFHFTGSALRPGASDPDLPDWNRPLPPEMPKDPPLEVESRTTARASLALFALRELPLVARESYRKQLWDHARAVAREGSARVVLVIGATGAGKSHLVESVARALEAGGWAEWVRLGYQREAGNEDGYAGAARRLIRPWNETRISLTARLRRRLARERGTSARPTREEADLLARWCGLLEEGEEPVAAGLGLREVYRSLDAHSWRGLGCMIIDDAQWAVEQGDGLAIAEAVVHDGEAGDKRHKPLLVFVTIRSEDLFTDPALAERIEGLVALGAYRIDVPRLDRAGTQSLLEASLTLIPTLRDKVVDRCEGNPLFARQLLIEWVERGWLVDTGGLQYGLAPGVDADAILPSDAQDLFLDRVRTVSKASGHPERFRNLLHMAALSGVSVPNDLLFTLAGNTLGDFALGCGMWEVRDAQWWFSSALLHQALQEQARARGDCSMLQRRLGRAWAKYGQKAGIKVDFEVGRHAHAGKDWKFAMKHLLPAAATAWASGRGQALDRVSSLADQAVNDAAGRLDEYSGWASVWRGRAFEVRGEAMSAAGKFRQAFQAFVASGDDRGALAAICGIGWAELQNGQLDTADALYGQAVTRARALEDLHGEAVAIAAKARVEQQKRNFSGANILFTRVLNRFDQLEDVVGAAEAILGQALIARRTGQFDDALELYEDASETFLEGDDPIGAAKAAYGSAATRLQRREYESAEHLFRESIASAEEVGATQIVMESRLGLASLYRHRGDPDRARAAYAEYLRWAVRTGAFEGQIFCNLGISMLALETGDMAGVYDASTQAVLQLNKVPGHWLWATYRLIVAGMLARRGNEKQTWEWLWTANELGLGDTVDRDNARCLQMICEIASAQRWSNVLRLAGKLGIAQLTALGQARQAKEIREQMAAALG